MLFSYCRFLLPHFHLAHTGDAHPEKAVQLQYYRLQKVMEGVVDLSECENVKVKPPPEVGIRKAQEENKPRSEIIETLNDRFGTDFSEADRLFLNRSSKLPCGTKECLRPLPPIPWINLNWAFSRSSKT